MEDVLFAANHTHPGELARDSHLRAAASFLRDLMDGWIGSLSSLFLRFLLETQILVPWQAPPLLLPLAPSASLSLARSLAMGKLDRQRGSLSSVCSQADRPAGASLVR